MKQQSLQNKESEITLINKELSKQLANPASIEILTKNIFKNFEPEVMKQAILEGMLRGYSFKDFLEKKVYAIKYGNGYSLVQSIDDARIIAMKSGYAGKTKPDYKEITKENITEIESCTITVKKQIKSGYIADFTATVFFKEFFKSGVTDKYGKYKTSMWENMPYVMIAKVAEMHALRQAFPEELEKFYIEDEIIIKKNNNNNNNNNIEEPLVNEKDIINYIELINNAKDMRELEEIFCVKMPKELRKEKEIFLAKENAKEKLSNKSIEIVSVEN